MKKLGLTLVMAMMGVMLIAGGAWALPLPVADFQGAISIDLDANGGVDSWIGGVAITGYIDKSGTPHSAFNPSDTDPILGKPVVGFGFNGINYDFVNDVLAVDADAFASFQVGYASDPFLLAYGTDIMVTKVSSRNYQIGALLSDQVYYHTGDSLFMEQYAQACGDGFGQILTWDLVIDLPDSSCYDYTINVSGKLAPVPEPGTMALLGIGLLGLAFVGRKKLKVEE